MGDENKSVECVICKIVKDMEKLKAPRKQGWLKTIFSKEFVIVCGIIVLLLCSICFIAYGYSEKNSLYISYGAAIISVLSFLVSVLNYFRLKKEYTYLYELSSLENINELIARLTNDIKRNKNKETTAHIFSTDVVNLDGKTYLKIIYD